MHPGWHRYIDVSTELVFDRHGEPLIVSEVATRNAISEAPFSLFGCGHKQC